jgi:predicted PurR-regulated permease PerM
MVRRWESEFASFRWNFPDRDGRPGNQAGSPDASDGEDIDIFPAIDPEGPVGEETEEHLAPVQPVIGTSDPVAERDKVVTPIEVPFRTLLKIVLTIFGVWLIIEIHQILLLVFISFLIALALVPPLRYLESRGLPRPVAAGLTFLVLIASIVGYFGLIVPPLIDQSQSLIDSFPEYTSRFERVIERYPSVNERYQDFKENGLGEDTSLPWSSVVEVGTVVVGGIANVLFVLVLAFYLLLEGDRSYRFLARYCAPRLRYRLRLAFPELTRVVSGFVIGQVITSTLFGSFVFATLTIAGVPQPLLLAVLAALLDAVPIVGVPAATVPAVLLALSVSWQTALVVLAAYTVYQAFENYVLVPRVYGKSLQVTSLSILVGVLIGGQLLGIVGIILSLPITAAIPVLERVWREEIPDPLTIDMI